MNESDQPPVITPARLAATGAAETERSYPLVALMQLGAVLGAIVVCIDGPKLWKLFERIDDEPWLAAALVATAMSSLGVIGLTVGLGQRRRLRSALLGFAVGATLGLVMLAIFAAPASIERCASGIAMVLISTILLRVNAA